MQVGGEGPEGPHRLRIAAGTDRCHVQGGADVNGPHGDGPGQCPAPGGSASVASWQAPPLDQGGGAGLRERINFLTGIALASPLSSPQQPVGQVWYRGLAHQKPDGRSPPLLIIAPAVSAPQEERGPRPFGSTRSVRFFCSTRSVRFSPEGSHAAGGQNGPDHRCDWVASSEEVELRGGSGAVGDERAALSPAARCL